MKNSFETGEYFEMNNTYVYTGNPIEPQFTLKIGDRELKKGTDFDLEITDNINAGTAQVLMKGKGKFTGIIRRTFQITPVPARSLSFFADKTEFDYTGSPCEMQIAVKFGETVLQEGVDYDVLFLDNVQPGRANAKLQFKGNFVGTMTIPFLILQKEEPEIGEKKEKPVDKTKLEPEVEGEVKAGEDDDFINTSEISSAMITQGESISVTASAQGGQPPYTFAVYYKKVIAEQWMTRYSFSSKTHTLVQPKLAMKYQILVMAKDQRNVVARKRFLVSVKKPK